MNHRAAAQLPLAQVDDRCVPELLQLADAVGGGDGLGHLDYTRRYGRVPTGTADALSADMSTRNIVIAMIGALSLFRAADATAQPRWGREQVPQAGACFYENANYEGRYFCIAPGEDLRQVPDDMRNRISSMRVVGQHEVTVFRDNDMRGRSAHFVGDVPDLRREGWNDQISSIVISRPGNYGAYGTSGRDRDDRYVDRDDRRRDADRAWDAGRVPVWGNAALPREGACFYEDRDFHGRYFCVPRGAAYTSLPSGFNDRISSIRVFGSGVRIWRDRDFRGRSRNINHNERDLHGDWRDVISSIQVR
jgi:Peptidase inhibitor family I36